MRKVYVLVDEHGEYSDYTKSVERVFASRERAEAEATRLNALTEQLRAANNVLCEHFGKAWKRDEAEVKALQQQQALRERYRAVDYWSIKAFQDLEQRWCEIKKARDAEEARLRAELFPQFMAYVSESYDGGYFKTDQDYKVEEHDFVEEA